MSAHVTNQQVGEAIGLGHSMVSRIRSGDRTPSLPVMLAIEQQFGWWIKEQAQAASDGTYGAKFELALEKHYGKVGVVA